MSLATPFEYLRDSGLQLTHSACPRSDEPVESIAEAAAAPRKQKENVLEALRKDLRSGVKERGLGGQGGTGTASRTAFEKPKTTSDKMSSDHDSSSQRTESNEEAIVAGMMSLAISCTHVQQQSTWEPAAAGKNCKTLCRFGARVLNILRAAASLLPFVVCRGAVVEALYFILLALSCVLYRTIDNF